MSFRSWAALVLLLGAVALERCGYYGVRSFLMLHLREGGMTTLDAAKISGLFTFVVYAAAFAGGGLAFVVGPRLTGAIGAFVAALGAFALAAGAPPVVSLLVVALGSGVFKPCVWAAGAAILADEDGGVEQGFAPTGRRFLSVAAFTVIAYGAINVGAMLGPVMSGGLWHARGSVTAFGVAGAIEILAAIAAGAAFMMGTARADALARAAHDPYRAPQAPSAAPAASPPRQDTGVYGPLVLLGIAFVLLHFGSDKTSFGWMLSLRDARWLATVHPVVGLVVCLPCAIAYAVLASQRSSLPLTKVLGPALVVYAIGVAVSAFAFASHAGIVAWAFAMAVTAAGEAVASPLGLTYAALAVRKPAATLVVAGWLSLTYLPTLMFSWVADGSRHESIPVVVGALCAVAALAIGVFVIASASRLHRQLGGHSNATS